MTTIRIHAVHATLTCPCGESCEVTLDGDNAEIDTSTIDGDLLIEAESVHGWHDGQCPACNAAYEKERAADDAMRSDKEGRAA